MAKFNNLRMVIKNKKRLSMNKVIILINLINKYQSLKMKLAIKNKQLIILIKKKMRMKTKLKY